MKPIYTIGYEGLDIDSFVPKLRMLDIDTVVDVRELPLSRKRGFSKNSLREALAEQGIDYVHVRALGCPREIRHEYREDGDWDKYTRRYLAHISVQTAALSELLRRALRETCVLLCYEANAAECHRTYVARSLADAAQGQLSVWHIDTRSEQIRYWPNDWEMEPTLA